MRIWTAVTICTLFLATGSTSAAAQLCVQPPSNCQAAAGIDAQNSTRAVNRRIADDFRVSAAGINSSICWRGVYGEPACATNPGDDFRVVYYAADLGLPGPVLGGPFSQSGGSLSVQRTLTGATVAGKPEYEYVASHAGVSLAANTCYWVEITNPHGSATTESVPSNLDVFP